MGIDFHAVHVVGESPTLISAADLEVRNTALDLLAEMTVTVVNRPDVSDERLTADASGTNLTADYNPATSTLRIFGTGTLADFQQVLRTVAYSNTSLNPNVSDRVVRVVADDGTGQGDVSITIVSLVSNNRPPDLAPISDQQAQTDAQLEVSISAADPDGDLLTFQLDSDSSPAVATIEQLTNNTAVIRFTPTAADGNGPFNFRVIVLDDGMPVLADQETFAVTLANPVPPIVDLDGPGGNLDFAVVLNVGRSPEVIVDPDLTVVDPDSPNLQSATAQILIGFSDGADESLSVDVLDTAISTDYKDTTGILTLSGSDTLANYERVLRTLSYGNVAATPNLSNRLVTVVVNDGQLSSQAAASSITLQSINDPPMLRSGLGGAGLRLPQATALNTFGSTSPELSILDGTSFSVRREDGTLVRFEFNSGPDFQLDLAPSSGKTVRDGDVFTVEGTLYEFDTGNVISVETGMSGGMEITEGSTITIVDDQTNPPNRLTFEFDSDSELTDDTNHPIFYTRVDNQSLISHSIATAINNSPGFNAKAVNHGTRISLSGDSLTIDAVSTEDSIVIEGSVGVRIGNRVATEESFSAAELGESIESALGSFASSLGNRLNFPGVQAVNFSTISDPSIFRPLESFDGTGPGDGSVSVDSAAIDLVAGENATQIAERVRSALLAEGIVSTRIGTALKFEDGSSLETAFRNTGIVVAATDLDLDDVLIFSLDEEHSPPGASIQQLDGRTAIVTPPIDLAPRPFNFQVNVSDSSVPPIEDTEAYAIRLLDPVPPIYDFEQAEYSVVEGDAGTSNVLLTIVRSGNTSIPSTVDVALISAGTDGGKPGTDIAAGPLTVSFAVDEVMQTVALEVFGDTATEKNELVIASLVNFSGNGIDGIAQPTATITILNDDLVINEIDSDNPGVDRAEFIELYDGGVGNTPLDGRILVLFNDTDDLSYRTIDLAGQTTDDQGFFLLGGPDVAGASLVLAADFLQTGTNAAGLYRAAPIDFPTGTPATDANLIDAVVFGSSIPANGSLRDVLTPGQPQVDENANP